MDFDGAREICAGVPGIMQVEQKSSCAIGGTILLSEVSQKEDAPPAGAGLGLLSRLPPELRNIIYHIVLGGHDYHVYAHTGHTWSPGNLSSAHMDGRKSTRIFLYDCTIHKHDPKLEWLDEHLSCFVDGHVGLPNMPLLRVSKQIYHETQLLPYSANTFIFIAPPSFETFVMETLKPVQVRALRSIAAWSPIGALAIMDESVSWKSWIMPARIRSSSLLSGLQHITLNFSIYDEVSLLRIDEVHRLLDLASAVGMQRKKLSINVTLNEAGRPAEEPEIDVKGISQHIEELRDRALMRNQFNQC